MDRPRQAGADNEVLAKQGIGDGIVPDACVLRVGEDGKTQWICDPEPEPAQA